MRIASFLMSGLLIALSSDARAQTDTPLPEPASRGVRFCGTTNHFVYVSPAPSTDGRVAPAMVRVAAELRNGTDRPLYLRFNTGQEWEIEVVDTRGNVVRRWSQGRVFLQALHMRRLATGDSLRFTGFVPMVDAQGNLLPSGNYTVRTYLTSTTAYGSTHSISHFRRTASPR